MMILEKMIQRLRLYSFFLFLFPSIAIIGSLLIHNHLSEKDYTYQIKHSYLNDVPGEEYTIDCTINNNYCLKKDIEPGQFGNEEMITDFNNCRMHIVEFSFSDKTGEIYKDNIVPESLFKFDTKKAKFFIKKESVNNQIKLKRFVVNSKSSECIKNYPISYFFYKYFPPYSYIVNEKVKGITLGAATSVNPFFYGEVSISNLVKRHPINIFFKSFLYLSVIFMVAYWYNYNKIFKEVVDKKANIFYFFGFSSAVLLFLHVYFLGTTSNSELLKYFRKFVIIFFILFEVFAQSFLAFKIYKYRNIFTKYCYMPIVLTKIFFVTTVMIFTLLIILILSIYNLSSNVDYILEWNYFIVLLLFYLLSALMWKKINF